MCERTKPTVGDIVSFDDSVSARHWGYTIKDKFLVGERRADGDLCLVGHEEFGNAGRGFAWVDSDDVEIIQLVSDRTLDLISEADEYEEQDEDDE